MKFFVEQLLRHSSVLKPSIIYLNQKWKIFDFSSFSVSDRNKNKHTDGPFRVFKIVFHRKRLVMVLLIGPISLNIIFFFKTKFVYDIFRHGDRKYFVQKRDPLNGGGVVIDLLLNKGWTSLLAKGLLETIYFLKEFNSTFQWQCCFYCNVMKRSWLKLPF